MIDNIGGIELDPDTYLLAKSNLFVWTNKLLPNIFNSDTLRNVNSHNNENQKILDAVNKKYDIIMANPPFGIKRIDYKNIKSDIKDHYIPFESKNAVLLFLQVIIYMLKVNGRAAIVLPDG